jgi:hypothetical protein
MTIPGTGVVVTVRLPLPALLTVKATALKRKSAVTGMAKLLFILYPSISIYIGELRII